MLYKRFQDIIFSKGKPSIRYRKYFNGLFQAIAQVNIMYLVFDIKNAEKDIIHQYHKERVFAYELYRQWANILKEECDKRIVLNAELDKIVKGTKIDFKENNDKKKRTGLHLFPDIVLHGGQGSKHRQIIICEIKKAIDPTISGSKILADLYKLSCYLDEQKFSCGDVKPFKYGVFIILNGNLKSIGEKIIKSYIWVSSQKYTFKKFKDEMGSHFNNIICVSYDGNTLYYETLSTILSQINV